MISHTHNAPPDVMRSHFGKLSGEVDGNTDSKERRPIIYRVNDNEGRGRDRLAIRDGIYYIIRMMMLSYSLYCSSKWGEWMDEGKAHFPL